MKITCPKNPVHNRFEVTAHVTQLWLVDEEGNFVSELKGCEEVTHAPSVGDMFICTDCEEDTIGVAERT